MFRGHQTSASVHPVPGGPHQAGIRRVPVRTIDLDHRVGGLCGGGGGGERRTRPRCDRIGFGWPGHSARPRGARVAFSFRWPLGLGERSGQVRSAARRPPLPLCRLPLHLHVVNSFWTHTAARAREEDVTLGSVFAAHLYSSLPRGLCVAGGSSRELVPVASLSFSSESEKETEMAALAGRCT